MSQRICGRCRWWHSVRGCPYAVAYNSGQCRRRAPVGRINGQEKNYDAHQPDIWPWTDENDGCGDFQEKKNERND